MFNLTNKDILITFPAFLTIFLRVKCSEEARRLYNDLIWSYDNKMVLPVKNPGDNLTINFAASLIRLIDVDEKNQVFTSNLWLHLQWVDYRLRWNPIYYGDIIKIHISIDKIWLPDIVLYNNAAGHPEISILTDALVFFDGTVLWKPPSIFKSFCAIDVLYFPYDEQDCEMKFGMWTYTGEFVDMRQMPISDNVTMALDDDGVLTQYMKNGMDLSNYYPSDEWELMNLTSRRYEVVYSSCCGTSTYVDIRYYFRLQRKALFYTVNLIAPCIMIAFLTMFVFYLPSQSMKKLTFSISLLVTLTVFFLVLIEMIPPTSLVIPLFGKYLLFTLIMVSLSISLSVVTCNLHFRQASQRVPIVLRRVFIDFLPRFLWLEPLKIEEDEDIKTGQATREMAEQLTDKNMPPISYSNRSNSPRLSRRTDNPADEVERLHTYLIMRVLAHVHFISKHYRSVAEEKQQAIEWMFIAMVVDRLFLFIFAIANILGTGLIILKAPTLYDSTLPVSIPNASSPLSGDTLGYLKWKLYDETMRNNHSMFINQRP